MINKVINNNSVEESVQHIQSSKTENIYKFHVLHGILCVKCVFN